MLKSLRQLGVLLNSSDRRRLLVLLASIILMALLELAGIAAILPFMRIAADPSVIDRSPTLGWIYDRGGFTSERQMLIAMGVAVLGLFALSTAYTAYNRWLIQRRVWALAHRIGMRLLETYAQIPYSFHLEHSSSDLLKKVISDVNNLVTGVLVAIGNLVAYSVMCIVILAFLMIVDPLLSLGAMVLFGGAYAIIHASCARYLRRLGIEQLDAAQERIRVFSEAMLGAKAIRAAGASPHFIKRFERASLRFSAVHPKFKLLTIAPRAGIEFMAFGGILGIVIVLLFRGNDLVSVLPVLTLFTLSSYKLLPALKNVSLAAAQLSLHAPVIDEVCRDLDPLDGSEPIGEAESEPITFTKTIRFDGVAFAYGPEAAILDGVDLEIRKGERVAFVGPTGSGKTTLIDLLIGLLWPTTGSVRVDQTALSGSNIGSWRRRIAYVQQDVFLFDASITANIAFGIDPEAIVHERVREAAARAQIGQFIEQELPEQYETIIGEGGVRLSGGQRQRLGLARAFYRHPEVLLLDEATSALDGITEDAVMRSLDSDLPQLTVVMIAHRLSTIRDCDRVFLIDDQRVAAVGTYDELLRSNETFRQMVQSSSS